MTQRTIAVPTTLGVRLVKADLVCSFYVHRSTHENWLPQHKWTVTHRWTGRLVLYARTRAQARQAAKELQPFTDWSKVEAGERGSWGLRQLVQVVGDRARR